MCVSVLCDFCVYQVCVSVHAFIRIYVCVCVCVVCVCLFVFACVRGAELTIRGFRAQVVSLKYCGRSISDKLLEVCMHKRMHTHRHTHTHTHTQWAVARKKGIS